MTRRSITLIAVLAAVVVLSGLAILLPRLKKPAPAAAAAPTIELSSLDKAKITRIQVVRKDGGLTVLKKGDAWTVDYPSPILLTSYMVDSFVDTFTKLTADSVIDEAPKDLALYGLAKPQATANVYLDDGSVKTFYLGDKTPTESSFYIQVKGDPKVYAVSSYVGQNMLYTVSDLRDKTITPAINAQEITYLRARLRDGQTVEVTAKTEAEQKDISLGLSSYLVTKPFVYPIGGNAEKIDALVQGLLGISIDQFVSDNPANLSQYGLDKPWGEIVVRDKTGTLGFQFGKNKDDSSLYFKIIGKPNVYTTSTSSVEFMNTTPFDLVDKFAYIPNIEDVDRIDVTANGVTHTFTLSRTVKKAEKAGEEDQTVTTYTADGKTMEESAFKDWYQTIIGLTVEGVGKGINVKAAPAATTRYALNKGSVRNVLVSYVPYNADFYAVVVNGEGQFVISKSQVNKMLSNIDRFIKGEALIQ